MVRWIAIIAVLVSIAPEAVADDLPNERAILAAITRAAEARGRVNQSVRIVLRSETWRGEEFERLAFEPEGVEKKPFPKAGLHSRLHVTLSLDGDRFRLYEIGEIPSGVTGGLVPYEGYHVVDGNRYAHMQPPTEKVPYWILNTSDRSILLQTEIPRPVAWHLRLRHPEFSPDSRTVWGVAEKREQVGKSECVVVAVGDGKSTYAFDPANGWIVRRRQRIERSDDVERSASETFVEFSDPALGEPRPVSWTSQRRRDGKIQSETKVKVVEWAVSPEWPDGTFEIRYPSRSFVREGSSTTGKPRSVSAVIDSAGRRHELTEQDVSSGRWKDLLDAP